MTGWFQPWPGAQGRWLKTVVLQEAMVTKKAGEFTGFHKAQKYQSSLQIQLVLPEMTFLVLLLLEGIQN